MDHGKPAQRVGPTARRNARDRRRRDPHAPDSCARGGLRLAPPLPRARQRSPPHHISPGGITASRCSWARVVSNHRPLACEASALPLSYVPYSPDSIEVLSRLELSPRPRVGGPLPDAPHCSKTNVLTRLSFEDRTVFSGVVAGRLDMIHSSSSAITSLNGPTGVTTICSADRGPDLERRRISRSTSPAKTSPVRTLAATVPLISRGM